MTAREVFSDFIKEPRWVVWYGRDLKNGKVAKRPVSPKSSDGVYYLASSTNPRTWETYDAAAKVRSLGTVQIHDSDNGRTDKKAEMQPIAGLGIMFGDGLMGVDIDHCRNPETGALSELAQSVIKDLASYTEISPSGTGVHILMRYTGDMRPPWSQSEQGEFEGTAQHLETYTNGRYFTVTGQSLGDMQPIADRTEEIQAFWEKYTPAGRLPRRSLAPYEIAKDDPDAPINPRAFDEMRAILRDAQKKIETFYKSVLAVDEDAEHTHTAACVKWAAASLGSAHYHMCAAMQGAIQEPMFSGKMKREE